MIGLMLFFVAKIDGVGGVGAGGLVGWIWGMG